MQLSIRIARARWAEKTSKESATNVVGLPSQIAAMNEYAGALLGRAFVVSRSS